jgi:signal transduction histidine kinase
LFVRYRHSSEIEKTQLRLLAIVATAGTLSFVVSSLGIPFLENAVVLGILAFAFGFPAAALVAILKHRLYDVEVLISKGVLYGILATLLTVLYVGVVVGIGALIGRAGRPSFGLSMLAAAVVAIAFQPIRARIQGFADRIVFGKRANPYEVLSEFSDRLASTYTEDVLKEMARLVGEGTGADRSEVWLNVGDEVRLEASWSPNSTNPSRSNEATADVVHGDQMLGRLAIYLSRAEAPSEDQRRLLTNLASQAGFILRNVKLVEDLRSSRQRIVAAQDEERRRMERDLHDGAQQQLVAMSVKLSLAQAMSSKDPAKASSLLDELKAETAEAVESLRDLARGIFPPLLAEQGLGPAIKAHTEKMQINSTIEDTTGGRRFSQEIEAATYFTLREALQNASKHSRGEPITVWLSFEVDHLRFQVSDQGPGFDVARVTSGSGLGNMQDRIEAIGGEFRISSSPSKGTTVDGSVPVGSDQPVTVGEETR